LTLTWIILRAFLTTAVFYKANKPHVLLAAVTNLKQKARFKLITALTKKWGLLALQNTARQSSYSMTTLRSAWNILLRTVLAARKLPLQRIQPQPLVTGFRRMFIRIDVKR